MSCGLCLLHILMENPMPERITSFSPTFVGGVFVSLAAIAINLNTPARAACVEQAPQPVTEPTHISVPSHVSVPYDYAACHSCHAMGAQDLRWTFRYDRAKGRKCWFLLDAAGHDVTEAHVQPGRAAAASTFWSKIQSWFGNLNLMKTANAEPENSVPRGTPVSPLRKQGDTVNANKKDSNSRAADRNNDEGRAAKRASQTSKREDERALFEEFMQWRERQKVIDPTLGTTSTRQ
jgi:hypothetical protein